MKILFTASAFSHIRNFHLPYIKYLTEHGCEVDVACGGEPVEIPYVSRRISLPFRKSMQSPQNFAAARILRREIKRGEYDLISTHTALAAFFTRLALKGMSNRPKVLNIVHGYLFDDDSPSAKRRILLAAEKITVPQTDLLLTMAQWDYEFAERHRLGARVAKIPGMGVDFSKLDGVNIDSRAALRSEWGIPQDAFVLIYAAEFSARKSQDVLLRALAELPENIVLVLPGSGALFDECTGLARSLGIERRVVFPGQIANMAPWYAMADAAVSSSRSEGLPFNIMEAMYCGLPVAASAVKGHVDLIAHDETGLLYRYGDSSACAEQILRLAGSPELRHRLTENARASVMRYDISRVLPQVLAQYASLDPRIPAVPAHSGSPGPAVRTR